MSDAYRTPARAVDETEIERAKIQEAGATERKLIEEREETTRKRINEVGVARYIVAGMLVVGGLLVTGILGHSYLDRRGAACQEESWKKETYGGTVCRHPLHVLVQDEKTWSCKCGAPKVQ